jgi:hypothetical protein
MKWLLALLLAFNLSAKAGTIEEVATSPTTFAVCKAADVASTMYLINSGIGHEANPAMASLMTGPLQWLPFIALSYGIYRLVVYINNPATTVVANGVTCAAAASNLLLIK